MGWWRMSTTESWTPVTIEARLRENVNENARLIGEAIDRHRAFLQADAAYDRAYARAYMEWVGSVKERECHAEVATEEARGARDEADVLYRHVERRLRAKHDELEALRSVGVSVRQAYSTGGGDG